MSGLDDLEVVASDATPRKDSRPDDGASSVDGTGPAEATIEDGPRDGGRESSPDVALDAGTDVAVRDADARLDAASLDATTLDSSADDASAHDATARDATDRDATVLDATTRDATLLDGSSHDATILDAGRFDGFPSDSAASDSAPHDGGAHDGGADAPDGHAHDAKGPDAAEAGCGARNTIDNCGACGIACNQTTATNVTCSGATCEYVCAAGRADCNATSGADTDGCECATPGCCPGSDCETSHSDGVGQGWYDCTALGVYNATQANAACEAFTGSASQCGVPACGLLSTVCSSGSPTDCVCWTYSGTAAGHVRNSGQAGATNCLCPTTQDPTWK